MLLAFSIKMYANLAYFEYFIQQDSRPKNVVLIILFLKLTTEVGKYNMILKWSGVVSPSSTVVVFNMSKA